VTRLGDFLERSRTVDVIERLERGEAVDPRRVAALQALDLARIGELFVLETLEEEAAADERAERLASGG